MSLVMKQDLAEGIAQLSYLVGDDKTHTAAVIDPRPDCGIYLQWARELGVAITHIIETHNHADFMSGARELAHRCGAKIYLAPEPGKQYGFPYETIEPDQQFTFGSTVLTARATPGHTEAHLTFEAAEQGNEDFPWGVFTGDSLFVDSAGRPDLAGEEKEEQLLEQLYNTLYNYFLDLPDGTIVYPGHGKGSACGPDIGDRLQSTIGYERLNNKYLQARNEKEFRKLTTADAPPAPTHYGRLKDTNAAGPPILSECPPIRALPPKAFREAAQRDDTLVVDTRSILAFGGAHVPGAVSIAYRAELSVYAGWMLDPDTPLLLVVEKESELDQILALFHRTGFVNFAGYLAGGMTAWDNAGLPVQTVPQLSVHDIHHRTDGLQILDVRKPSEWESGHVPGAQFFFIGDMRERMPDLDPDKNVAVYCGSGYRASIAASLLQAHGYEHVFNVPGSWSAWKNAGYPVEDGEAS